MSLSVVVMSGKSQLVVARVITCPTACNSSVVLQGFVLSILTTVSSYNTNLCNLEVGACRCLNSDGVSLDVVWSSSTGDGNFLTCADAGCGCTTSCLVDQYSVACKSVWVDKSIGDLDRLDLGSRILEGHLVVHADTLCSHENGVDVTVHSIGATVAGSSKGSARGGAKKSSTSASVFEQWGAFDTCDG